MQEEKCVLSGEGLFANRQPSVDIAHCSSSLPNATHASSPRNAHELLSQWLGFQKRMYLHLPYMFELTINLQELCCLLQMLNNHVLSRQFHSKLHLRICSTTTLLEYLLPMSCSHHFACGSSNPTTTSQPCLYCLIFLYLLELSPPTISSLVLHPSAFSFFVFCL